MAYEVEFDDGTIFDFEVEPTPELIAQARNQWLSSQKPKKPDPTFNDYLTDPGRAIPRGITRALDTTAKGIAQLGASAVEPFSQSTADDWRRRAQKHYDEQELRREQEFGKTSTNMGEVVEGVSEGLTMVAGAAVNPAVTAATIGGYSMGAGTRVLDELNEKGVDPDKALGGAQFQTVSNALLGLIPGMGVVRGALMNWATGQATDMATYEYLVQNGYQEAADVVIGKRGLADKQGLIDILVGGVGGRMGSQPTKPSVGERSKSDGKSTGAADKAKELLKDEPTKVAETPEQIEMYRRIAEQRAQELRDTPIHVGADGTAYPRGPVETQGDSLPWIDPRLLEDLPPTLPEAPRAAPELPGIREIQDQVPLLPETRVAQEGAVRPEAPLPRISEEFTRAGLQGLDPRATGDLLGMAPELPPADGVVRPINRGLDAKPDTRLSGMDESVPTIDFPLRQEVLNKPHMKASVARFRKRAAEAKTPEARQKVENDFAKFMRKYGVGDAADAHGLNRLLYEPKLRDPMSIRKSGELDQTKSNMEGPGIDFNSPHKNRRKGHPTDPLLKEVTWLRQGAGDTIDWRATLDEIANDPLNRKFGSSYGPLLEKMRKYYEDNGIKITLRDQLRGEEAGVYRSYEGDVLISRQHNTNHTVMHELVHGMTARWLLMNPNHPVAKQLEKIRLDLVKKYGPDAYGLTNTRELLSEFNTNPKFKEMIGKPGVIRSLWNRLLKAMGFTPTESSLINRLNKMTDEIAAENKKITDTDFRKWANEAKKKTDELVSQVKKVDEWVASVDKGAKNSTSEMAVPHNQNAAYAKALREAELVKWLSKDPDPKEVREKVLSDPDIQGPWALIGSSSMTSAIKDHSGIWSIGQYWSNRKIRAERYNELAVKPLHREWQEGLRKGYAGEVMEVLKAEAFAKRRLTPEELDAVGFSPEQRSLYEGHRREMDAMYKETNDTLKALGQKGIPFHEAYLAMTRHGDWKAPVFNKDGKMVWYVQETSKPRLKHALKKLGEQFPELDMKRSKIIFNHSPYIKENMNFIASIKDIKALLGDNDPLTQRLSEYTKQKIQNESFDVLGYSDSFKPQAGIRGFTGDRPWINSKKDLADLIDAQMNHLKDGKYWIESQKAMSQVREILTPEVMENRPNFTEWARQKTMVEISTAATPWLRNLEKTASKWVSESADWVNKFFPEGYKPLSKISTDVSSYGHANSLFKTYFYIRNLGVGNLPFVQVSLTQPIYTIPHHMMMSNLGYKHNLIKTTIDSMAAGPAAAMEHYAPEMLARMGIEPGAIKKLDPLFQDAAKFMEVNAVAGMNPLADIKHADSSRLREGIEHWGTINMTESERLARAVAFMGFVSHLDQSRKSGARDVGDDMALFQEAKKMTELAMVNYEHNERATIFNKMGMAGETVSPLQAFKINQLNQVWLFARHLQRTKDPKPLLAMLGIQTAVGGLIGMFGIETAEELYNLYRTVYTDVYKGTDPDMVPPSPKEMILRAPEALSLGLYSQVTGRNFTAKMDAGKVLDPTLTGLLPVFNDVYEQGEAFVKAVRNNDAKHWQQFGYAMAPASQKGWVETSSPELTKPSKNPKTGEDGYTVMNKGSRSKNMYWRTQEQQDKRGMPFYGMTSPHEFATREQEYNVQTTQKYKDQIKRNITVAFNDAIEENDPAQIEKMFIAYLESEGDAKTLMRSIKPAYYNRILDLETRLAMKTGNPVGQYRYLRYKEAMKALGNYTR